MDENIYDLSNGKTHSRVPVPDVERGTPSAPAWLDSTASAEWVRVVSALDGAGVLADVDGALLTTWAVAYSVLVQASRDVQERGVVITGARNGEPVRNPAVAMQRDASATLRATAKALGLEPGRREPKPVAPVSEFDRWLANRGAVDA